MSQCTAVENFYRCELEVGHTFRHRDKNYTWMDQAVLDARAQARQKNVEQDDGKALEKLLRMLKGYSQITNWKTDEHQKAMWFDAILDAYREIKN